MEYVTGYFKKIKENLKNKEWYHQRFDGAPAFISFIAYAELKQEKRKTPYGNHTLRVCFYENPRADWYIYKEDIKNTTNKFLNAVKKERNISKKLIERWKKDKSKFYKECAHIKNLDLKRKTNKELIQLYNHFKDIDVNKVTNSSIIDGFALGSDEIIAQKILDLLREKDMQHKFTEYFSKLTAPTRISFINDAEINLYKIILEVSNSNQLKEFFLKNKPIKIIDILDNPLNYGINDKRIINNIKNINEKLLVHQKNWFWTKNNYHHDNILTIGYFINEIQETLHEKIDIKKKIEKIKNTPKNNKKIKNKLFKELNIDSELKELLKISDDFTWWQDERKKSTFWATHYFSLLMAEIGDRVGLNMIEMKYLTPEEISAIFTRNINKEEIRKRISKCVIIYDSDGHECITGNEVEILRNLILGKQDYTGIKEIKGLCASVGKATGKVVKVRSATEIYKVQKGDILVAVMTRPDYVVGMKKAAAIVTNEGGITSHAAIVSRELGIPCVIGTKIAMNVLKDGQKVEVDADNGVVRLL